MSITKRFTPIVFISGLCGTITLRWLALEFLYRLMPDYWKGIGSTIAATLALSVVVSIIIARFLRPIDKMMNHIKETGEIKESDKIMVASSYRKTSIVIIIENVVGFIIGQFVVMVLDVKAGVVPYQLSRLVIIMIQATFVGTIAALYQIYYLDNLFGECRHMLNIHSINTFRSSKNHTISTRILIITTIIMIFMGLNCFTCGYALINNDNITPGTNVLGTYLGYGVKCILVIFIECFGLILIVVNEMKKRINATSKIVSELETSGDLSRRINLSMTDDISILISNLNSLMDKLTSMITSMKNETSNVSSSARILTNSSSKSIEALNLMKESVTKIGTEEKNTSNIIQKTYIDIEHLKENAKDVENQVFSQSESIERASASITQMVGNITSIASTAKEADTVSEQLRSTSQQGTVAINSAKEAISLIQKSSIEIQEAIQMIQKIASQTNLLSMNASIEAAHAGSFGTGFAVVANEVRNLANTSANTTVTIKKHMKDMAERIQKGVEAMQKAGEAFSLIDSSIERNANLVSHITEATEEQRFGAEDTLKATQDVVLSIDSIKQLTSDQRMHTENVFESSKNIISYSQEISNALDLTTQAFSNLNDSLLNVDKCAIENTKSVMKMQTHIDEYKTINDL